MGSNEDSPNSEKTIVKKVVAPTDDPTVHHNPNPISDATVAISTVENKTVIMPRHTAATPASPPAPNTISHLTKGQSINPEHTGLPNQGDVIRDRFVIQKTLGSGGMGAVYRALDLRKHEADDEDAYIAIKLLSGNFQQHEQAFVTMQREAKKTQVLAHPNIVTVYDFDRDGDLIYITMEELIGHALNDYINGKTEKILTLKERYSIVDQIAKGLSYAHSKGIVHSDLKPGNIFICDNGTVKILDFGIARAANEELYRDSFDAGKLGAMTFSYASLEMIELKAPHPSDDIYALGIIAYELLGNGHPYNRKDAQHAHEHKLKPQKLPVKNPFLRKCLANTIAIERKDRIADASTFLKKFHRSRTTPKNLFALSLALLIGLTANILYIQTIEPERVPFESLSMEDQNAFHTAVNEGHRALKFGDLQGAVQHINTAFELHETQENLLELKEKILTIVHDYEQNARSPEEKAFAQEQLNYLSAYPAFAESPKE